MDVSDFDFELPEELIAQAAVPRGQSRLMQLDRGAAGVHHRAIDELPELLREGDVLVVNDTRVFPARLLGRREPSGGAVECLLLSGAGSGDTWDALMHPGQKLKPGSRVRFEGPAGVLMGEVLERRFHGRRTIRLWSESSASVDTLIDALGHVPLPPYIKREDTPQDRERYQTVYARARGSVAAPTAGLHFSDDMVRRMAARGVEQVAITLHVGYGTFKPVRAAHVEDHVVDPEPYEISGAAAAAVNRARAEHRRVIAVGTTTTRALESAAQATGEVIPGRGEASLFIYPGFTFRAIDGLLTNFHLPRSSLLMLVAAFGGTERVLAAYKTAVAAQYRFYSYGDAMLVM
jgi:S-adenosylmethionine:tRNA ribosyltransferase-isomerase